MKILVCKHVPHEGLGYFETALAAHHVTCDYQELYQDPRERDLSEYQGLIIMGGPMNVDQEADFPFLGTDFRYIERGLQLKLPMLGFCLGAQLFAKALGGRVFKNACPELGWYEVEQVESSSILQGFPARFHVFQWHEDTFEIPAGGALLATSPTCHNQAFAYSDHLFGFQFHLEVTEAMIAEWLKDKNTVTNWGFQTGQILHQTPDYITDASLLGELLCRNFIAKL